MQSLICEGQWLNPPPKWSLERNALTLETGDKTDFWRHTHYGFVRDDGHFWHVPAPSSFTATVTFAGKYETLYDQAGLMLRVDPDNWIKLGIEHSDGMTNFSIVVTRGRSDWSVIARPLISGPQTVRLTVKNNAALAHFKNENGWQLMRVADFPAFDKAHIGPMACSPERSGFEASFSEFQLTDPIENPLH
ncbi:DUF1349 domain-containing protein [Hoeflea poritis]|uniref:DUF1349 domain-containing protein n=1 Tax=Hoeflea poritis TaxID=2993659 RepID=A0ABT4VME2_9HYPH|nr:DUF1349 domain-containing protein [Hoeflea poritis]MDA4845882.1 DUF1349 domain-containing protein [Hoeflea poritis]